jgi:ribonuclease VapC
VILDSSAILAILLGEPDRDALLDKLGSPPNAVGAPTLFETTLVLTSRCGWESLEELETFLHDLSVSVVPFEYVHWAAALEAHRRFGKGRHPAGLNFGDCLAYAVARVAGEPLLCTGNDFPRTDLPLA